MALSVFQDLANKYPAQSLILRDAAYFSTEIGEALRMGGHRSAAAKSYNRAIEMLGTLIAKNESVTVNREHLMQAKKGLGATQLADHKTAEAAATWRQAIAIGEGIPSLSDEPLYWLAGCHALLGGVAGESGSGLLAEEGPAELDRAMDALRRAVAAGYRSVSWIRRDPDLKPLHSRPDFQLLMMDLAMPAEPFAPTN